MKPTTSGDRTGRDDLTACLVELRAVFPEMRWGQLVMNLADSAGVAEPAGVWDVEDDALLTAARRLLERNRGRIPAGGRHAKVESAPPSCPVGMPGA